MVCIGYILQRFNFFIIFFILIALFFFATLNIFFILIIYLLILGLIFDVSSVCLHFLLFLIPTPFINLRLSQSCHLSDLLYFFFVTIGCLSSFLELYFQDLKLLIIFSFSFSSFSIFIVITVTVFKLHAFVLVIVLFI